MQGAERHARSAAGTADAEYRDCSCGGAEREAQSRACKFIPLASGAHGCLTPRSSGAPTAGHQRPDGGTRYIFTVRALASCRCRPLSSNVRPQNPPCRTRRPSCRAECGDGLHDHRRDHERRDVRHGLRHQRTCTPQKSLRSRQLAKAQGNRKGETRRPDHPNRRGSLVRGNGNRQERVQD